MNDYCKRIKSKSIAVASGKGGVGKTTTSVNLALYYSRKGLKTALIDLDPLSDAATMLDREEVEAALTVRDTDFVTGSLDDYRCPVFDSLDLLFPQAKLQSGGSRQLYRAIFEIFARTITEEYEMIIFDMPAGYDDEENINFLEHIGFLLIVTNSEPASHVASGTFIRKVSRRFPESVFYLWNNRFSALREQDFNPVDLWANYNRNVPEELQMPVELSRRIESVAFIPEDPTLDLLQTNPSPLLHCRRSLYDKLRFLENEHLDRYITPLKLESNRLKDLIKEYVQNATSNDQKAFSAEGFSDYLFRIFSRSFASRGDMEVLDPRQKGLFEELFRSVRGDAILQLSFSIRDYLLRALEASSKGLFRSESTVDYDSLIDKKLMSILQFLKREKKLSSSEKKAAALLVFDFSVYKLLKAPSVVQLIERFIPQRSSGNRRIRDKYRQIGFLIEEDAEYKKNYLALIRNLYPVVIKQVMSIVDTFGLQAFLLRDSGNQVVKKAYLTLLSDFLHNSIYSGLGVIIGFRYRPASLAFQDSADKVLSRLRGA